ncbi:MAG: hypothetical protein ACREQ8_11660, partial [Woeseiaceae bacterium]
MMREKVDFMGKIRRLAQQSGAFCCGYSNRVNGLWWSDPRCCYREMTHVARRISVVEGALSGGITAVFPSGHFLRRRTRDAARHHQHQEQRASPCHALAPPAHGARRGTSLKLSTRFVKLDFSLKLVVGGGVTKYPAKCRHKRAKIELKALRSRETSVGTTNNNHRQYGFGEFTLDVDRGALLKGDAEVGLRRQSFDV